MKTIWVFLVLIALIVCQNDLNKEEAQSRRKQLKEKMVECILKSESLSADLKKEIENNKEGDIRKILKTRLDTNVREIIKKCRSELFEYVNKEKFNNKLHSTNSFFAEPVKKKNLK